MSDVTIQRLEAERAALHGELSKLELYQNLVALDRVIALLRGDNGRQTPDSGKQVTASDRSPAQRRLGPMPRVVPDVARPEAKTTADMKAAVEQLLRGKVEPVTTKDIHDHLVGVGVRVPGNMPTNNLSAHLSRDDKFLSWGRDGWTLADEVKPLGPELLQHAMRLVVELDDARRQQLAQQCLTADGLPQDFDREVLSLMRYKLGRNLLEEEKRILREEVRKRLISKASEGFDSRILGVCRGESEGET